MGRRRFFLRRASQLRRQWRWRTLGDIGICIAAVNTRLYYTSIVNPVAKIIDTAIAIGVDAIGHITRTIGGHRV